MRDGRAERRPHCRGWRSRSPRRAPAAGACPTLVGRGRCRRTPGWPRRRADAYRSRRSDRPGAAPRSGTSLGVPPHDRHRRRRLHRDRPQPAGAGRAGGAARRAGAHAHRAHGRGHVGLRADAVHEPGGGRGVRARLPGDDRDLDRDGVAGRVVRVVRHRQLPVVGGGRRLPPRRGASPRSSPPTGTARRSVASSSRTARGSGWTAATGSAAPGSSAPAPATPATWPPGSSRSSTGSCSWPTTASPSSGWPSCRARAGALHRRLARAGAAGHRLLRLRAGRRLRAGPADVPAVHPGREAWRRPRLPDGPHAHHRGGPRGLGARGRQEHARRRRRVRPHQDAHG